VDDTLLRLPRRLFKAPSGYVQEAAKAAPPKGAGSFLSTDRCGGSAGTARPWRTAPPCFPLNRGL